MRSGPIQSILPEYLEDLKWSFAHMRAHFIPVPVDFGIGCARTKRTDESPVSFHGTRIVEAVHSLKRFVLTGAPGSGKTTTLHFIAQYHSQKSLNSLKQNASYHPVVAPVFIELGQYVQRTGGSSLLKMIAERFYPYCFRDDLEEDLETMLKNGNLMLLLDGFNEVPSGYKAQAASDIAVFLNSYPAVIVVLSSRLMDLPENLNLPVCTMRPLDTSWVTRLVVSGLALEPVDDRQTRSEDLVNHLTSHFSGPHLTPLLVSIALDIFRDSDLSIPANRGELYLKFMNLWFTRESRKLDTSLQEEWLQTMLRLSGALAFRMHNFGELSTSWDAAWSFIGNYIDSGIPDQQNTKKLLAPDNVLDQLHSMDLLVDEKGRVKFSHQLHQEFFAAYHLCSLDLSHAITRAEKVWWEDVVTIYAGIVEDATAIIRNVLENRDPVFASGLVVSAGFCDPELKNRITGSLFELLQDKFRTNRISACEALRNLKDHGVDLILDQIECSGISEELRKELKSLNTERASIHTDNGIAVLNTGLDSDTPDFAVSLGAAVSETYRMVQDEGIATAEGYIHEAADSMGMDIVSEIFRDLMRKENSTDRFLFAAWAVSQITGEKCSDLIHLCLAERKSGEVLPSFCDVEETNDVKTAILCNILLNPEIDLVWKNEIGRNELIRYNSSEVFRFFAESTENYHELWETESGHFRILLQILWEMDRDAAEEYLMNWIEVGPDSIIAKHVLQFFGTVEISHRSAERLLSIMRSSPDGVKGCFLEPLARSGSEMVRAPLISIVRNTDYTVGLRKSALQALRWIAGAEERVLLAELKNSDHPEIYDTAFDVLQQVERRMQLEDRMFDAVSAADIPVELLFDDPELSPGAKSPQVFIDPGDPKTAIINGVKIDLGPVSGRIFSFLAEKSTPGRYQTIDEIIENLQRQDFYLEPDSVRRRITDIRSKIKSAFEGRINTSGLIEKSGRFGYRLNASVNITRPTS